jgi:hypothetical protein
MNLSLGERFFHHHFVHELTMYQHLLMCVFRVHILFD